MQGHLEESRAGPGAEGARTWRQPGLWLPWKGKADLGLARVLVSVGSECRGWPGADESREPRRVGGRPVGPGSVSLRGEAESRHCLWELPGPARGAVSLQSARPQTPEFRKHR